jgi:hypothetical protein
MNQNFQRSDNTYEVKKDQKVESHFLTFDVLFDVLIFDVLIFRHSDHPKNTFNILILQCSDLTFQPPPKHFNSFLQDFYNLKILYEQRVSYFW